MPPKKIQRDNKSKANPERPTSPNKETPEKEKTSSTKIISVLKSNPNLQNDESGELKYLSQKSLLSVKLIETEEQLLKSAQELSAKPVQDSQIKYLSEKSLPILNDLVEKQIPVVPPTTPQEPVFNYRVPTVPATFPRLNSVKLPNVREVGVKASIQKLADIFRCMDYELNLVQFWFLDVITDCLWRSQDEFQFPEVHQRIILEWILYIFNLIRDTTLNLPRKKLFKIFIEAMSIAEDYIQTGCSTVPIPEQLFALNMKQEKGEEESNTNVNTLDDASSNSTISLDSQADEGNYLAVKFENCFEVFKIPKNNGAWDSEEECLSSSIETLSEDEKQEMSEEAVKDDTSSEEGSKDLLDEEIEFYKPDLGTPPRFQPSRSSLNESVSISYESIVDEETGEESGDASWVASKKYVSTISCPSKNIVSPVENSELSNKLKDEETLKAWYDYHLWQIKKQDMENPRKGATIYSADRSFSEILNNYNNDISMAQTKLANGLRAINKDVRETTQNIFVNTCVLLAIKQFVFEYFYESFQFSLLRIAFRFPHEFVTQELNEKWNVPKLFKGELKKPSPRRKVKKEKKHKEHKPRKEKSKGSKGGKRSKTSKSTKTEKSSKKSKSTKGSKKEKKPKVAKPKALTKEEKAKLADIEKQRARLEEETRKLEENRRFMFPLTDAATDEFFQSIFEGWVKPKKREKVKKEKLKSDDGKSDKSVENKKKTKKKHDKEKRKTKKK